MARSGYIVNALPLPPSAARQTVRNDSPAGVKAVINPSLTAICAKCDTQGKVAAGDHIAILQNHTGRAWAASALV